MDGSGEEINLAAGMFRLHEITSLISYSMKKNSLEHMVWVGGKDDWLVLSDTVCQIKLLNPISGVMINLPSFSTIGVVHNSYSLEILSDPCNRNLRRVVLNRTPCSIDGIFAIALLSDGLMAYMSQGFAEWKLLKHHTKYKGCYRYFPEVYMDALVHGGRVVAVDEEGFKFSWNIEVVGSYLERMAAPVFLDVGSSEKCTILQGHAPIIY